MAICVTTPIQRGAQNLENGLIDADSLHCRKRNGRPLTAKIGTASVFNFPISIYQARSERR